MTDCFSSPIFNEAVKDMASLGLEVSWSSSQEAIPYAVIGGRTNARWWLIPVKRGRVAASSFALFQPLLLSARLMKAVVGTLSRLGFSSLWVRQRVYITGSPSLSQYFGQVEPLTFAYFTGTDSPHRKLAVQIMDSHGNLKGFAKLSREPPVRALLMHEAKTLKRVEALDLQTAYVPRVLFCGEHGGCTLLVTDTLKTPRTSSTTHFTKAHYAFVQELARKTVESHKTPVAHIAANFRGRADRIEAHLGQTWLNRMYAAIRFLESQQTQSVPTSLSHGDFTPWNTFLINGRLYVFDWEYSEAALPASNDLIHFVLNEPNIRNQSALRKIETLVSALTTKWTNMPHGAENVLLMIYLLGVSFRHIERSSADSIHSQTWDGATQLAALIDGVVNRSLKTHLACD